MNKLWIERYWINNNNKLNEIIGLIEENDLHWINHLHWTLNINGGWWLRWHKFGHYTPMDIGAWIKKNKQKSKEDTKSRCNTPKDNRPRWHFSPSSLSASITNAHLQTQNTITDTHTAHRNRKTADYFEIFSKDYLIQDWLKQKLKMKWFKGDLRVCKCAIVCVCVCVVFISFLKHFHLNWHTKHKHRCWTI